MASIFWLLLFLLMAGEFPRSDLTTSYFGKTTLQPGPEGREALQSGERNLTERWSHTERQFTNKRMKEWVSEEGRQDKQIRITEGMDQVGKVDRQAG